MDKEKLFFLPIAMSSSLDVCLSGLLHPLNWILNSHKGILAPTLVLNQCFYKRIMAWTSYP